MVSFQLVVWLGVGRGIFEVELVNETKLETDEKLEVQAAKQYKQITAILMNLKGECHGWEKTRHLGAMERRNQANGRVCTCGINRLLYCW